MQDRLQILVLTASLLLILLVLELIRRGRLREEYSLVWLVSAIVVFFLALFPGTLQRLASLVQVSYGPSLIFMVGIGLLGIIQLLQTVTISRLTGQNRVLAQKLGILDLRHRSTMAEFTPQMMVAIAQLATDRPLTVEHGQSGELDLRSFLRRAIRLSLSSVPASSGSILILDETGQLAVAELVFGGEEFHYDVQNLADTLVGGLAGWVVRHRQPALVLSTKDDARWLKRPWDESDGSSRSAMSAPLLSNERVVGVLTLVNTQPRRFMETDMGLLVAIATVISAQAGGALQIPGSSEEEVDVYASGPMEPRIQD